ncbi:MAG: NAD-dependent epimerase/dehydratase family protein [Terracidiphilus sp.]|jgi:nucleoside-diphosphate-sugar epimerase
MTEAWNGRKVLVAGGAGLIGSYLVEHLLRDGASVRVADSLESGTLDNLGSDVQSIEFVKADLKDPIACNQATRGMDTVFDLAARTVGIGYSSKHHGEMFCDSMMIALNLMESARQAGVERYLVTSSSCVYPDNSPIPTPESAAETNQPEEANAGYGWAKRMAELQGMFFAQEYGMEMAIVRLVNAYGPRYHWSHGEPHVIPALIRRLLNRENPLVIWGSGRQTRSFIHAVDIAMLMKLIVERKPGPVPVNIGQPEDTSISDLVSHLTSIAGYDGEVLYDASKPEGPARKCLDLSLQNRLLPDFKPSMSLRKGLEQTYSAAQEFFSNGAAQAAGR